MEKEKKLESIFEKYTNICFDDRDNRLKDSPLLGIELNIRPIILMLILLEIESQYSIKLSRSKVIDGEFSTFNSILKMIEEN
ncbi:peptide maturation system acyl carrier-related protein [Clostridium botulinum]|uniref:peptide maturation system acyl carrier-related protein n=1 Tax=Clostridium botulinum TaxID=1491 RepID=UPI003DA32DAD